MAIICIPQVAALVSSRPFDAFPGHWPPALPQLFAGNVRQEIVDEGGMNLVLSLFSNAVKEADVLVACFPLLQQMIAHGMRLRDVCGLLLTEGEDWRCSAF